METATTGRADDDAVAQLRAHGERLTPQRLLVLGALRASGDHLTADQVFELVTAQYPYINRATIYRALTWLKDQGLVCVTDLGGGQLRYQYLTERHHHHLVCLHCGSQQEFPDDLVNPLAVALHNHYGFAPRLDHLAVFGFCRACQAAQAE